MKNKQFAFNTVATMINLIIHFSLSFFLTSYLVRVVGSTAYGFFSMANSVVNYALIITNALNSMSARFIGIGIHNNDYEKSKRYFSSVFYGNFAFALIILIPSIVAILNLDSFINIPSELLFDVKCLFFIVFVNMCCNVVFSVFGCVYTIKNRLDIVAILQVFTNIVKAILLIILYSAFNTSIVFLGISTLVSSLILAVGNTIYTKKLLPELKLSVKIARISAIKEIVLSGIWNSFNQLSVTLLNGLDLIITNLMVSAEAMGVLSIASTIPGVISACISNLSNLFTPKFLELFSHKDYINLKDEIRNSIRFMTVISCIPVSFLIAFGVPFYRLWTPGTDIKMLYILSILVLLPQFSGGAINSMNYLYTVANKVKWQSIVLFMAGITNVIVVFTLLKFTDLGVYAVAGVSSMIGFIRNFCFNAPYAAYCINQPKYIFWPDMLKSCGCLALCVAIGSIVNKMVMLDTWVKLIIIGGGCTIICGVIVAFIVLSKEQKRMIFNKIRRV